MDCNGIIKGEAPQFIIFAVLFANAYTFAKIIPKFEEIPRGIIYKKIAKWVSCFILIPSIIAFFMIIKRIVGVSDPIILFSFITIHITDVIHYDIWIIKLMFLSFCSIIIYGLFEFIIKRRYEFKEENNNENNILNSKE